MSDLCCFGPCLGKRRSISRSHKKRNGRFWIENYFRSLLRSIKKFSSVSKIAREQLLQNRILCPLLISFHSINFNHVYFLSSPFPLLSRKLYFSRALDNEYQADKIPCTAHNTSCKLQWPRQIWYFYQLLLDKAKNSDLKYFRNAGDMVFHLVLRLFSNSTSATYLKNQIKTK